MSYRLTFAEFEFLEKVLQAVDKAGNELLVGEDPQAVRKLFTGISEDAAGTVRIRIIDTVGKVQRIREKLRTISGNG